MTLEQVIHSAFEKHNCRCEFLSVMAALSRWSPVELGNLTVADRTILDPREHRHKDSKERGRNYPGIKLKNYIVDHNLKNGWEGWYACHIWDEKQFGKKVECYSRAGNMVLVPRAFYSLSDYFDQLKLIFKRRCYELYKWCPDKDKECRICAARGMVQIREADLPQEVWCGTVAQLTPAGEKFIEKNANCGRVGRAPLIPRE